MSFRTATRTLPMLRLVEQRELLRVTGTRLGAEREHMIYSLVLGTALREHEVVALNVGNVMHQRGPRAGEVRSKIELTTFKGVNLKPKRARAAAPRKKPITQIVYLPKATRRKLAYYLKWKKGRGESLRPDAPLFAVSKDSVRAELGGRLSTRTMRYHFRRWQGICRFETLRGFHALRHTALSNIYRKTKDLKAVQSQARHASVKSTEIYTHLTEEEIVKSVEDLEC